MEIMLKSSIVQTAALLGVAAMLAGCNANSSRDSSNRNAESAALVSLTGCLEEAAGTNRYVLRHVRFEPRGADAPATTTTPGNQGITEGSWVQVDSAGRDLREYLGQRVKLDGTVIDSGGNTIGTAGTSGVDVPSGDKSQAASREHHSTKEKKEMGRIARESMADGTAAEVRATEVVPTGDRCTETSKR
jgi:hypothetical protein